MSCRLTTLLALLAACGARSQLIPRALSLDVVLHRGASLVRAATTRTWLRSTQSRLPSQNVTLGAEVEVPNSGDVTWPIRVNANESRIVSRVAVVVHRLYHPLASALEVSLHAHGRSALLVADVQSACLLWYCSPSPKQARIRSLRAPRAHPRRRPACPRLAPGGGPGIHAVPARPGPGPHF